MKKRLSVLMLTLVCILMFTGCCFHSEWYAATCTDPKTCVECGETEGEALGHTWEDATCTDPKTCEECGETEGEALGHDWVDATTEAPKTCATCSETEGERIVTDERFTTAATADIQGNWECEIEMTGEMLGLEGFDGALKIKLLFDLNNDGTMEMGYSTVNSDEFSTAMYDFMVDTLYAEFEAQGISKEEADAAMMDTYEVTVEGYAELLTEEMDFAAVFESLSITGVYYVEDELLYTGMSWDTDMEPTDFTVDGDTLTVEEELSGLVEDALVFTRVVE